MAKPHASQLVETVRSQLDLIPPDNLPDLRGYIAGSVFEQIAHTHLERGLEKNHLLLSPEEIFDIYHQLYPYRPTFSHYGGLGRHIRGVFMEDGILLRQATRSWQVDAVYEMKAGAIRHQDQLAHYKNYPPFLSPNLLETDRIAKKVGEMVSILRPGAPNLPLGLPIKTTEFYIVVPEFSHIYASQGKGIEIPFSRRDLAKVVEMIVLAASS